MDGPSQLLPALYSIPQSEYHDITTGSNGGYTAGVGYDLVTGRGTPVANVLVPALDGVNQAPTLNAISNPAAILENAGAQTVSLSGISTGPSSVGGNTVTITATSSNPSLIPNPTVSYTNPNTTGTLGYTPVANAYGSAVITVTVTNGGGTANGGVNTFTQTFTVNVTQVNMPPTIAPISSPQTVLVGAGAQTVNLTGISYGPAGNIGQTVTITAASSNPALVSNPTISYTSPNATGTLSYTPSTSATGSAVITVTVQNNGGTANGGNNTVTETFTVNVYPLQIFPTSTALTALPLTITYGQSVALTATVSSTPTPNEGIVTFLNGTTTLGTAPVSNSVATLNVTTISAGNPAVTAVYSDSYFNFANSTSPVVDVNASQATPSVTVSDASGTYKGSGFAAASLVNGGASLEGGAPTYTYYTGTTASGSGSSTAPVHVGTYTVVASFAGSTDYASAQSNPATFTISPAPLTITANNQTKVYGAALPTLTASYTGFLGSDTSASLTAQPTLSTTATATSAVAGNPYPITVSGAVDPDYTISYVAGSLTVTAAPTTISLTASAATINSGQSVTLTATVSASPTPNEGTVTFASRGTTLGTVSVVAGVAQIAVATLLTGTDAVNATYSDSSGNYASSIPVLGPTSTIIKAAGAGNYSGDGGPATQATLHDPYGEVMDAAGDIFIADSYNNVVREVNHATGVITTVAGTGTYGYNGDNIVATAAELSDPVGLALDAAGDLFISDESNQRIREVNAATKVITTVAGNGGAGFSGDNVQATATELYYPAGIAIDSAGDLLIADYDNNRIREVNKATGVITTVAGNGTQGFTGDGAAATAAELNHPVGLGFDSSGDLFIADTSNDVIRELVAGTGTIKTVAGIGTSSGFSGDGGLATAAKLNAPYGVALDSAGDLFIADIDNSRIREVNAATGVITTVAGSGTQLFAGDGGPATAADLILPSDVLVDAAGDLFITDTLNNRIREVNHATQVITTVAGSSYVSYPGNGGPATTAPLSLPEGEATDAAGDLFIADEGDNVIREVNHATGVITTVVGNGTAGFSGDGGQATAAELNQPQSIVVDAAGDLFIADSNNHRIREVNHATGVITTVAGNGTSGYNGDNIAATAAEIEIPQSIALDAAGDLFIADNIGDRIREVNATTKIITTIAGNGIGGYNGDGAQATASELQLPKGVAVDSAGDVFIADEVNNRIREVNSTTGVISTVVGNGIQGYSGDGGQATAAELNYPDGIALDSTGDLFISDSNNGRIREVNSATGVITTFIGNSGQGSTGNGGPASAAKVSGPAGLSIDAFGDLFIADSGNNEVREIVGGVGITVRTVPTVTVSDSGGAYQDSAYAAMATVNGFTVLEGVSPTLTYYAGSTATGTPLSGAPVNVGTYTVVASFTGSTDYSSAQSSPATFTITAVPLTITANNQTKTYGARSPPSQPATWDLSAATQPPA